jgi:hypothetical protein
MNNSVWLANNIGELIVIGLFLALRITFDRPIDSLAPEGGSRVVGYGDLVKLKVDLVVIRYPLTKVLVYDLGQLISLIILLVGWLFLRSMGHVLLTREHRSVVVYFLELRQLASLPGD